MSLFESFQLLRPVQIGRYLREHWPTEEQSAKIRIIWLLEHFQLLRPVHIGSYLRVTLAYRGIKC